VRYFLENTHHIKGLGEWLKVEALSSSLSSAKGREKKKKRRSYKFKFFFVAPSTEKNSIPITYLSLDLGWSDILQLNWLYTWEPCCERAQVATRKRPT
jgi:hypothetical protein